MLCLLAASPLLILAQQSPPVFPREWVVKEVVRPHPEVGVAGFFWEAAFPIGDVDRDALPEVIVSGRSWNPGTSLESRGRFFESLHLDDAHDLVWQSVPLRISLGDSSGPATAHLATPTGTQLAIRSLAVQGEIEFIDPATRALLAVFTTQAYPVFRPAGDLDADGWDDIFVFDAVWQQPLHLYAVSGRDQSIIWQDTEADSDFAGFASPYAVGPVPDLDGDGIADPLIITRAPAPGFANFAWVVACRSGATGALLWRQFALINSTPGIALHVIVQGPDWTGDAIPDCAVVTTAVITALDGATGAILWTRPSTDLDSWMPLPHVVANLAGRPAATRSPADSTRVELILPVRELDTLVFLDSTFSLIHLDAATGAILHRDPLPADLAPFDIHTTVPVASLPKMMPLGDVDRDGFLDYALQVGWGNEASGGFGNPPGGDSGMVFLGPRTLFGQPSTPFDRSPQFTVHLPGAAGRPVVLAAALGFDRFGGERIGSWRSHLLQDPLLSYSLMQSPWVGTLDTRGVALLNLVLPPQPGLVGHTLVLKALVPQSSGSDLWTASTLSFLEILP